MKPALFVLLMGLAAGAAATEPSVVPRPASIVPQPGAFALSGALRFEVPEGDPAARVSAQHVAGLFAKSHGTRPAIRAGGKPSGVVMFVRDGALPPEGYRLQVLRDRVEIRASTPVGLLYGGITLWQLANPGKPASTIPAVTIEDAPQMRWRGVMLDSARHFQSPAFIRDYLDWMALHKLNVLHWHLTDDQAWRLEIRKYPKLTEAGAWRVPAGAARGDIDPATGKPRLYGGFYSQATVRELVAYARDRGITIVPEIEMPGHATAAIVAYPQLAAVVHPPRVVPADWGVYPNAFNLEEPTFDFLTDVLDEVLELFPSLYIHVGGDEVEKDQWKHSPAGLERMRVLGLTDPAGLQGYFTQRIARHLESRGRKLVGWDEILVEGMPKEALVMSWRGADGAIAAAAKGHYTVMAAHPTLYFDHRQSARTTEPPGRGKVVTLEDVYRFDPIPPAIAPEHRQFVLGVQAQVWTEHIRTEARVAHMTWPRAAAVAELGWTAPERRAWPDFAKRMQAQAARYERLGIPYAKAALLQEPVVDITALERSSREMKLCTEDIALALEDDAPLSGPRATFLVDIQNPCWIFPAARLDGMTLLVATVGQLPFNFQIGEAVKKIRFESPRTIAGELVVRRGGCHGEEIARLPLAPALKSEGVTRLPPAALPALSGAHDLCFQFAQDFRDPGRDPFWVVDRVRLTRGAR